MTYYYKYLKYKNKYLQYAKQLGGTKTELDLFLQNETNTANKFSLLAPNVTRLKELLDHTDLRKLNFIAAYIIDNPTEVLSRILIYNCFPKTDLIHDCSYFSYGLLEISIIYEPAFLLGKNKICLDQINKCLDEIIIKDNFILPIQCCRKNLEKDDCHYFLTLIIKKDSDIRVIIIDPYLKIENKIDFQIGDDVLFDLLKNNINFLKKNAPNVQYINSNRQIVKMPQAITNDLSCQIWSLMYQYIYLCSDMEPTNTELDKYLNINPFYHMMMFLTNIYDFYKYKFRIIDKRKDISDRYFGKANKHLSNENNFKYFDMRKQFLHLIENCSADIRDHYMHILISNGQSHLTNHILCHPHANIMIINNYSEIKLLEYFDKYLNIINNLNNYIIKYGNISIFKEQIKSDIVKCIQLRQQKAPDLFKDLYERELKIYTEVINILQRYQ
jgi:hypothetical protein